jgi:hypothetical protein
METQNFNIPLTFQQVAYIVKQLPSSEKIRLAEILEKEVKKDDFLLTHIASQNVLSQDWLSHEEDQAWQHL